MNAKLLLVFGLSAACLAAQGASYYVNDASTNGDVYSAAPGALANSGTTSNAPKASLQDILTAYALGPGDTVFVDTGNYTNGPAAVIGPADSGGTALGLVRSKARGAPRPSCSTRTRGIRIACLGRRVPAGGGRGLSGYGARGAGGK